MDPVSVGVGLVVVGYGVSVVVDPHAVPRLLGRVDAVGSDRETFDRNWRVFGLLATAIGCYAVALGAGL